MNRKSKNTVKNRWDFEGITTCDCGGVRMCVCLGCSCVLSCVYMWVVYSACVYEGTCATHSFYRMLVICVSYFISSKYWTFLIYSIEFLGLNSYFSSSKNFWTMLLYIYIYIYIYIYNSIVQKFLELEKLGFNPRKFNGVY